ncbi:MULTISPECIES: hypothetical protein [Microcystis]|uniref:hypothetical protein n=1 Tax=Microcystis TaxID=1125 RepID=UPI0012316409|nr:MULTISPECIES: hypothetical protein [Microcystis]MCA2666043.1 hypothetical protein [Microcystis sp. M045S2]
MGFVPQPNLRLKKKIDPPSGGKKRKRVKRVKREKREKGLQSPPEYADYPKTAIEEAVDAAVVDVANRGTAVNKLNGFYFGSPI